MDCTKDARHTDTRPGGFKLLNCLQTMLHLLRQRVFAEQVPDIDACTLHRIPPYTARALESTR